MNKNLMMNKKPMNKQFNKYNPQNQSMEYISSPKGISFAGPTNIKFTNSRPTFVNNSFSSPAVNPHQRQKTQNNQNNSTNDVHQMKARLDHLLKKTDYAFNRAKQLSN